MSVVSLYAIATCIAVLVHSVSREVNDRDEINEFLRNEIRMTDMRIKVRLVCGV